MNFHRLNVIISFFRLYQRDYAIFILYVVNSFFCPAYRKKQLCELTCKRAFIGKSNFRFEIQIELLYSKRGLPKRQFFQIHLSNTLVKTFYIKHLFVDQIDALHLRGVISKSRRSTECPVGRNFSTQDGEQPTKRDMLNMQRSCREQLYIIYLLGSTFNKTQLLQLFDASFNTTVNKTSWRKNCTQVILYWSEICQTRRRFGI